MNERERKGGRERKVRMRVWKLEAKRERCREYVRMRERERENGENLRKRGINRGRKTI